MEIKTWHEGMSDAESKDLAYWERNMLALKYADGWYNDDIWVMYVKQRAVEVVNEFSGEIGSDCDSSWEEVERPRYEGWRRVLSLENGAITFHIPDEFPVGNLPEIERNWDGHTTEEKWRRIAESRGISG